MLVLVLDTEGTLLSSQVNSTQFVSTKMMKIVSCLFSITTAFTLKYNSLRSDVNNTIIFFETVPEVG